MVSHTQDPCSTNSATEQPDTWLGLLQSRQTSLTCWVPTNCIHHGVNLINHIIDINIITIALSYANTPAWIMEVQGVVKTSCLGRNIRWSVKTQVIHRTTRKGTTSAVWLVRMTKSLRPLAGFPCYSCLFVCCCCIRTHSRRLYSAAPMEDKATSTIPWYIRLNHIILTLSQSVLALTY